MAAWLRRPLSDRPLRPSRSRRRIVPNLIAKSKTERKTFVGDQLDSCNDFSGLQYRLSLEKGYPVNWETQTEVWTRIFGKDVLAVNTADCDLMLSTPPLCPSAIQATIDEMVFEHFNFRSFCTMCPQVLAHYAQQVRPPRPRAHALVVERRAALALGQVRVFIDVEARQPTIRRANTSITNAT
jgi:actin-related protein